MPWVAQVWLPYLLAGILWIIVSAAVLGEPQGAGIMFIGVSCLSIGSVGVSWRLSHGGGLYGPLPRD